MKSQTSTPPVTDQNTKQTPREIPASGLFGYASEAEIFAAFDRRRARKTNRAQDAEPTIAD